MATSLVPENEPVLILRRTFTAPRELVFKAWTDPKHLARWFGPKGIHTVTHSVEIRPGGTWVFDMIGTDGTVYPNRILYEEITSPERLVYAHGGGDPTAPPEFHATVTFVDRGGATEVTLTTRFPTLAARDQVKGYAVPGGHSTLERLAEHLAAAAAEPLADEPVFRLTRVFRAPRDLVWKAFTEPERLVKWWGPRGLPMIHATMDLRPGGSFHFCLQLPDGGKMWAKWTFVAIVPPEKLVQISAFSDEHGGLTGNPMTPDWPLGMLNTITLLAQGDRTVMQMELVAHSATAAEQAAFAAGFGSMTQGFGGSFDQLEELLAAMQ